MKKLLALILCVMMFVAVIPTAAFAAPNYSSGSGWGELADAKTAVKNASNAIEYMLKGIAADQGVFGTVSAIDNLVTSLSKSLYAGITDQVELEGTGFYATSGDIFARSGYVTASELENATKQYLRATIGAEISTYMKDRESTWYDSEKDRINPEKYLNTFAAAASNALNSAAAQKGLEELIVEVAALSTLKSVTDEAKDLATAIADWDDGNKIFAAYGFQDPTVIDSTKWAPLALDVPAVQGVSRLTGDTAIATILSQS